MGSTEPATSQDPHRWLVFSAISMVYFFVYFHRVSTSVIVSDLLEAFDTSVTALGFMSSIYFYLYAAMQPVVGYLSDRFGPRRVICYWSLMAAAGCFLFGLAPGIGWASAGRALIGIGVAGVYVPAMKAFSQWFRKEDFATMIGLLMSIGNLGAVVATTPLAWAAGSWGWRVTFFLIGGITVALAFAILLFTRDYQPSSATIPSVPAVDPEGNQGSRSKIIQVLASGQFWIIAMIFFGIYGTLVTLQGLWATPFLMSAFDIDRLFASKINMLIPVGVIMGAPLFGWLPKRFSMDKRNILIAILVVYTMTWGGIIFFFTPLGIGGVSFMLLVMGLVAGGFISLTWGVVRDITPDDVMGLTSGMLNPAPFLGVAVFQVLTSAILDAGGRKQYGVFDFQNAFYACLLVSVICLGLSLLIRRTKVPASAN